MIQARCEAVVLTDQNEQIRPNVQTKVQKTNHWHSRYLISLDLPFYPIQSIQLVFSVECLESWYLTSDRHLSPIVSVLKPPIPVGRFAVIRTINGYYKVEFPWATNVIFRKGKDEIQISTTIQDKTQCGFVLWGKDKLTGLTGTLQLTGLINRLKSITECLWLEPYPDGARAAICLTDHADFDTVEKWRLLTDFFVRNEFRLTKSVFPKSDPRKGKNEPGLDVPEYTKSIEKLYEYGSEIAYHGFGPRVNAPPLTECYRRAELMRRFQVTTWTDHGTGRYLFSGDGIIQDGILLENFLKEFGIVNYWSYTDVWNNPIRNLNCWTSHPSSVILQDIFASVRFMNLKSYRDAIFYILRQVKNLIGNHALDQLRNGPLRWINCQEALRLHNKNRILLRNPLIIYGENGATFPFNSSSTWIFDTILLNYLGFQLNPNSINKLFRDSGLSIGHCYLADQSRTNTHNSFTGSGGNLTLTNSFMQNIEYISERQRNGDVISLPFNRLRQSLVSFANTELIRDSTGWIVKRENPDEHIVVCGEKKVIKQALCDSAVKSFRQEVGYLKLSPFRETQVLLNDL